MSLPFDNIAKAGLSPNQFYVLYCIVNDIEAKHVNIHLEIRSLKHLNLLDDKSNVTPKGLETLQSIGESTPAKTKTKKIVKVDLEQVEKYRELWPNCKIPTSGKYARSDKKNLTKAFTWFLTEYDYSWDTILKATAMYVDEYEAKNWAYMRTSQYFIKKSDADKSVNSDLANYCSLIESGVNNTSPFVIKEKICVDESSE
jgi:hypothetical protein